MKKMISFLFVLVVGLGSGVSPVLAHVTVKPVEVGVGERVTFSVSVPTEEETATIGVKLLIPEGVTSVRPTAKPGWNIELVKVGEGDAARVSEINWTGGSILPEQRDDFDFSAQAPTKELTLAWKAYQTYASGTVVSWDASPEVLKDHEEKNPNGVDDVPGTPMPYSVTKVVNDLKNAETKPMSPDISGTNRESFQTLGTIASLMLSAIALVVVLRKKK